MAEIIMYASTSGAGLQDGTSWNNRAALISGGTLNSIFTSFDFTSNSLRLLTGSGTYSPTSTPVFSGSSAPSNLYPCIFQACDSSGDYWLPPNKGWLSSQPVWDTSEMPYISQAAANFGFFSVAGISVFGFKLSGSNPTTRMLSSLIGINWCLIENSGSNGNANITDSNVVQISNSVLRMTGSSYSAVIYSIPNYAIKNVRIEGNPNATTGSRIGWSSSSNGFFKGNRVTILGNVGGGILCASAGSSTGIELFNSVIYANGGDAVASSGTLLAGSRIHNSIIVNNSGYGIVSTASYPMYVVDSRLRNNASGNYLNVNTQTNNLISSGLNTDEFVNTTGTISQLNLTVKNSSSIWNNNYGVGDQVAETGVVGQSTVVVCRRN